MVFERGRGCDSTSNGTCAMPCPALLTCKTDDLCLHKNRELAGEFSTSGVRCRHMMQTGSICTRTSCCKCIVVITWMGRRDSRHFAFQSYFRTETYAGCRSLCVKRGAFNYQHMRTVVHKTQQSRDKQQRCQMLLRMGLVGSSY
jgi:hypothetical protein